MIKLVENAQAKGCKIAMYGHTHMPLIENEDGILVINPGSLTYPRQRGRRPSYAVMQIEEGKRSSGRDQIPLKKFILTESGKFTCGGCEYPPDSSDCIFFEVLLIG